MSGFWTSRRTALLGFGACLAVQTAAAVWLRCHARRALAVPAPPPAPDVPLSVVVAAKNEADRLGPFVDALDWQTHGPLEIVVVDDGSTDATPRLLADWAARHPKVRVLQNAGPPGKKGALGTGIAAARHAALALTDADCAPPPGWAADLAARLAAPGGPVVVVGYAPYRRRPGALNALARYETLATGWLTAAAVGAERPYMALGRSLAYPRAVFEAVGGFSRHQHLLSGDDDLFVQDVHRARAARVIHASGPASLVPSEAPGTWRAWHRQKTRHLSDGRHYPPAVQAALAVYHGSAGALWLAPLAGPVGGALLGVRLALHAWALRPFAASVGERDLVAKAWPLDLALALYQTLAAPAALARPLRRW